MRESCHARCVTCSSSWVFCMAVTAWSARPIIRVCNSVSDRGSSAGIASKLAVTMPKNWSDVARGAITAHAVPVPTQYGSDRLVVGVEVDDQKLVRVEDPVEQGGRLAFDAVTRRDHRSVLPKAVLLLRGRWLPRTVRACSSGFQSITVLRSHPATRGTVSASR